MAIAEMTPPGVVQTSNMHGPQRVPSMVFNGSRRLRRLLKLSTDVSIEDLCEEAADRIEEYRRQVPERIPETGKTIAIVKPDKPRRGPGRPRKVRPDL
jgi:hypothetical protein